MSGPPVSSGREHRPSALVIAARHALLAPFLVDQRGLAALLAQIADRPGHGRGARPRPGQRPLLPDVLTEHPRERVRQGEHLRGPEAGRLTAADPRELTDDLLEAAARGE